MHELKNVIITGGTGSIGTVLSEMLLERGYEVNIFTRQPKKYKPTSRLKFTYWNPSKREYDAASIEQADAIIGLAGAGIADKKWSRSRKDEIYNSRIFSARLILEALENAPNKVSVVVNASATGFYGLNRDTILKEADESGEGFLAHVCRDWENTNHFITYLDKRSVILRTGVVLDKKNGAYPKMTSSIKFGIAGLIGSGEQIMSWIHIKDLCRMYLYALENETMEGVYNACSPNPISVNKLLDSAAREKKRKVFKFRIPSSLIRFAVGELADEALFQSQNINVDKILKTGFQFEFPDIDSAVRAIEEVR